MEIELKLLVELVKCVLIGINCATAEEYKASAKNREVILRIRIVLVN